MQDLNSDNISLIYEFNQDSPLFARVAAGEIAEKNYDQAKEILEDGIKKYPNYPTAYFIYAEVLARLSDYVNAVDAVEKGGSILDVEETKEYYLTRVEEIKNKNSMIEESKRVSFYEDGMTSGGKTSAKDPENSGSLGGGETLPEIPLEDRLEELASQLDKVKIQPAESAEDELSTGDDAEGLNENDFISVGEDDSTFDDAELVSETMAMILEGQGKLLEAKNIYEKLKTKEPDKSGIFDLKINEIEQKLSNNSE